MKPIIPRFEGSRVLIVGDVMLDRYWHGSAARISPEAPVPVVKVEEVEERPGGAANVAVNVATLGGQARVLGIAGLDEAATVLETKLRRLGVICDLVRLPGQATITKLRVLSRAAGAQPQSTIIAAGFRGQLSRIRAGGTPGSVRPSPCGSRCGGVI